MKILVALSLMCSSGYTRAEVVRDERLWSALIDLQGRMLDRGFARVLQPASAAIGVGALAVFLATFAPRVPAGPWRTITRPVAFSVLTAAEIHNAAAIFLVIKHRTGHWWPASLDAYGEMHRQIGVESAFFAPMLAFLEKPASEQYAIAANDPDLREYLVELDDWMRAGSRGGTPPVRRGASVSPK